MSNTAQTINKSINTPAKAMPDLYTIKAKMRATWMDGDYDTFSRYMERGAEEILTEWNIQSGETVLDVGCGSGQTALPAARQGAIVSGIDIAANLIEAARRRAANENLIIKFEVGDAELIPYQDASFDKVISMIGAMFAPQPEKVAAEFARVCRSEGILRMANWTPQSMPGQMFKIISQYVASPAGIEPPVLWGVEDIVQQRLQEDFRDITLVRKFYPNWFYSFSAAELVKYFRAHFGPVRRAFELQDTQGQQALFEELEQNFENHNMATDGTLHIKGEYLDVYAVRR
jgi:ubiquinone/menaquinone biosynthesis C-methylase UbiE